MRYLIVLLFIVSNSLVAQVDEKATNRWEISASFAPQLNKRISLLSRVEDDPWDVPIVQQYREDTININGTDRIFYNPLGFDIKPQSTNFWFGAKVKVHRRFANGFDLSVGFHFDQGAYTSRPEEALEPIISLISGDRLGILYSVHEDRQSKAGIVAVTDYHLFARKKIHPYFGLGISLLYLKWKRQEIERVFTEGPGRIFTFSPSSTRMLDVQRLQFDFIANGGVLYQFSPQWSAGIEVTTFSGYGPGLFGFQLRHII